MRSNGKYFYFDTMHFTGIITYSDDDFLNMTIVKKHKNIQILANEIHTIKIIVF